LPAANHAVTKLPFCWHKLFQGSANLRKRRIADKKRVLPLKTAGKNAGELPIKRQMRFDFQVSPGRQLFSRKLNSEEQIRGSWSC
jgi:hypothetical protein